MKLIMSFLRVLLFATIAFVLFEELANVEDQWAFEKYPIIQSIFWGLVIMAIFIEIIVGIIERRVFNSLSDDAKVRYLKTEENNYFNKLYAKLLDSRAIEEEGEIILDHNYDGIKELDNTLPPWWVYMFYLTIFFAIFYLLKYEVFDGESSAMEYETEIAKAKVEVEEYKRSNPELLNAENVVLLSEESDLKAGKSIFDIYCVVCHKADGGGGIGPNLTDENWILGGGIKNIFTTISDGGRDGKGMVSWKQDLNPQEIAQVSSYVLEFQGTTPAEPKTAEGDVWIDQDAAPKELEDTSTDEDEAEVPST